MSTLDLAAIRRRYSRALDAKPGKGPISEAGIVAITDSVCDIPQLLAEVEGIRQRWAEVAEDESWWIGGAWGDYGEVVTPLRVLTYVIDGELDQMPQDIDPGFATRYADQVARAEAAEAELADIRQAALDGQGTRSGADGATDADRAKPDRFSADAETNDTSVIHDMDLAASIIDDARHAMAPERPGPRIEPTKRVLWSEDASHIVRDWQNRKKRAADQTPAHVRHHINQIAREEADHA